MCMADPRPAALWWTKDRIGLRSTDPRDGGQGNGHIPVVAVTANARAEQQAAALEAGMNRVVTKPFRMLELLPELERVRKLHSV
jgi:CheY-like chemotaxis protein